MKNWSVLLLIAGILPTCGWTADIFMERVVGSEFPGAYKHPASITELDNGDLYLTYYGGSGEYGTDTAVYSARLRAGTSKWSAPEVIADEHVLNGLIADGHWVCPP